MWHGFVLVDAASLRVAKMKKHSRLIIKQENTRTLLFVMTVDREHVYSVIHFGLQCLYFFGKAGNATDLCALQFCCGFGRCRAKRNNSIEKISLGSSVPKSFATVSAVQYFLCIHSMPVLQPFDIFVGVTSQPLVANMCLLCRRV